MSEEALTQKAAIDKKNALELSQWRSDLSWLMGQPAGKRLIGRFVVEARKRVFTNDERTTNYNVGRQAFLLDFIDSLKDADLSLFQALERAASEKLP